MHFELDSWADFVRGVAEPKRRGELEAHLTGCSSCNDVATRLRKLAEAAGQERRYDVPEYAVRAAKAIFALQRPERVQLVPRLVAKLVFDSFREPLPAGVRGAALPSRQTLYEAGRYAIDLRIEQERGAREVVAIGQLLDISDPQQRLASVPVVLSSGAEVLATAKSNAFGEFHLRYRPSRHLRLSIPVGEPNETIEVDLDSPSGHDSKGS